MENNTTWCGNFSLTAESKEIINKLKFASDLLFLNKEELIEYTEIQKDLLTVEFKNKEICEINFHTFLFFQDYQKYWQIFKNFDNINIKIFLEDLLSDNSYIDFINIDENNKKVFFSDLLIYFNENLFKNDIIKKDSKFVNKLLLSYAFKEIFKNAKNNFIIPEEYQGVFLSGMSEEKIIQYNWNSFKKIFNSISLEVKDKYFSQRSRLNFFVPVFKLAYAHKLNENQNIVFYSNLKIIISVRNNFEEMFTKNQSFFKKMLLSEQKLILKMFVRSSRKELFEYVFHNYTEIQKENYLESEYQELNQIVKKSNFNIDLDKYFLFKKLDKKLKPKKIEKKLKI